MIFLKKFISAGILSAVAGAFLCGCTSGTHKVPPAPMFDQPVTSATTEAAETQAVQDDGSIVEPQDGVFIYDKLSRLTNTEYDECNTYARMLYNSYLINTAVVLTDDLKGMEPEAYAAKAYNDIYGGMGSGLLFLVNNETHEDILYKTGECLRFIDEVSERDELYHATKALVVENYKDAVLTMLRLGEKCPANLVDNSNIFDDETAEELDAALENCSNNVAIVATNNLSSIPDEELLKNYFERRFSEETGFLVLMDKKSRSVTAMTQGELPAEVAEIVSAANQSASGGDFSEAASRLISDFDSVSLTVYDEEPYIEAEYEETADDEMTEETE